MKTPQEANIGDTLVSVAEPAPSLPGFKPSKPMVRDNGTAGDHMHTVIIFMYFQVFASVYPVDTGDFSALESSVRLCLFCVHACEHSRSVMLLYWHFNVITSDQQATTY
jgi:translation elongation factor EF-4